MIHALGQDIVEVVRMERDIAQYGQRFIDRILGDREKDIFDRRVDQAVFLAGRFACKEAVIKALGFRLTVRPPYSDLQILNDPTGRPELVLPSDIRDQLGSARCLISLAHEQHYAVAIAIITED